MYEHESPQRKIQTGFGQVFHQYLIEICIEPIGIENESGKNEEVVTYLMFFLY